MLANGWKDGIVLEYNTIKDTKGDRYADLHQHGPQWRRPPVQRHAGSRIHVRLHPDRRRHDPGILRPLRLPRDEPFQHDRRDRGAEVARHGRQRPRHGRVRHRAGTRHRHLKLCVPVPFPQRHADYVRTGARILLHEWRGRPGSQDRRLGLHRRLPRHRPVLARQRQPIHHGDLLLARRPPHEELQQRHLYGRHLHPYHQVQGHLHDVRALPVRAVPRLSDGPRNLRLLPGRLQRRQFHVRGLHARNQLRPPRPDLHRGALHGRIRVQPHDERDHLRRLLRIRAAHGLGRHVSLFRRGPRAPVHHRHRDQR